MTSLLTNDFVKKAIEDDEVQKFRRLVHVLEAEIRRQAAVLIARVEDECKHVKGYRGHPLKAGDKGINATCEKCLLGVREVLLGRAIE